MNGMKESSRIWDIFNNGRFVLKLALISFLVCVVGDMTMYLAEVLMLKNSVHASWELSWWRVDRRNHEPIYLKALLTEDFQKKYFFVVPRWIFFTSFFNISLCYYLRGQFFSYKYAIATSLLSLATCTVGYVVFGSLLLNTLCPIFSIFCTYLSLKWCLPQDSRIPKVFSTQFFVFLLGVVWLKVYPYIPLNDNTFLAVYYMVMFPLLRELLRFVVTRSSWYLSFDAGVGGKGVTNLKREIAWVFYGWMQVWYAVFYRLSVISTADPLVGALIIVWQSLLEVVLRLTHERRDRMVRDSFSRHMIKRKATRLAYMIHPELSSNVLAQSQVSVVDRGTAQRQFYSLLIMVEMMAEYVGIFSSCLLFVCWKHAPLVVPQAPYATQALDEDIDASRVVWFSVIQFLFEVCVDNVCINFEHYDTKTMYKNVSNKRHFFFFFALSTYYGTYLAHAFIRVQDNFQACQDQDMCYCVNNGLVKKGVREAYCMLIYPGVNWGDSNFTLPALP